VHINCGDFADCLSFIDSRTFVYIDPPYRPLSTSSCFTAYCPSNFDDAEQLRLGAFVDELNAVGAKVVVSNSDPKNSNDQDNFFDDLYKAFYIDRIAAKRSINSNAERRGRINELLISN
jgi:DNA adenine methylase